MFISLHLNEFLHRIGQPLVDLLVDSLYLSLLLVLHDREWHESPDLPVLRLPVLPERNLPRTYDPLKQLKILKSKDIRTIIRISERVENQGLPGELDKGLE